MTEEQAILEGRINQEERLQEEVELRQRMDQRIELIRQIADLERARDQGVNRLRRLVSRDITIVNFTLIEEHYNNLLNTNNNLISRILEWEDLLEVDEEGSTIYPDHGRPEFRYSPHAEDFKNRTKVMEMISVQAIEALKTFYLSLTAAEKATVSQLAQTVFLRNPAEWVPEADTEDQPVDQEEDAN